MTHDDWDAKEFVERMINGDSSLVEELADLSPEQLAEVELVLNLPELRELGGSA